MSRIIRPMDTRLLWLGVLLASAFVAPAYGQSQPAPNASLAGSTISDWKGKVQLQLPGQTMSSPRHGEALPTGTLIDTNDGRLLLRLTDGSQVLVRAHTRLMLKQISAGDWNYLQLLLGRILAHVSKRTGGAPPFQLGTPTAVISVRGTRFEVEVNRHNITEVDVFEGLVEVAGAGNNGPSVLVEPDFSTRVGQDAVPESPRPTDEIRPVDRSEREMDSEHGLEIEREQEPPSTEKPGTSDITPDVETPSAEPPALPSPQISPAQSPRSRNEG
jgi:hypothetical protein